MPENLRNKGPPVNPYLTAKPGKRKAQGQDRAASEAPG